MCEDIFLIVTFSIVDEFKGHCLLEAARQADPAKVKKYLTSDVVNFKHPYTGDTPLVILLIPIKPLWHCLFFIY